ncbi:hypothetical protein ABOM_009882 [Aspergillus bombycis]|uniref:Uncharacterized protein n=1 Tax=Aspergillus bombycis TaxID=109264 RepID=A0A1F7ZRH7_9EURO|nr:hypothetical protein ABOM_009882 [Aspergillus bombycis]OGM41695.1 hypothetical protein ABOM_009882 [Aspergillus bombycis]
MAQAVFDDPWTPLANILYPSTAALHETFAADSTAVGTGDMASDFPFGLSGQEQSIVHRMYSSSTGTSTEPPYLDCFSSAVAVNPANHELTGLHDLGLETTEDASASDDDLCRAIQSHEEIIQKDERFQRVDVEEVHWQHDIPPGGGFNADILGSDNSDPNELDTLVRQLQFPDDSQEMIGRLFVGHTSNILSIREDENMDPWQGLVWPMTRDCPALYHALAAMTCAHISNTQQQLNLLSMKHLNLSVQALVISMNNSRMSLEAAIATRLALAFAESWDCHASATGITHLNDAQVLIQRAIQERFASGPINSELECLKFLINTWLYRNVLARLTCTEPTGTTIAESVTTYTSILPHIDEKEIDPLMGCGTALFPSIGRLVELVRRVRGRPENRNSPAIISKAIEIKMALEGWVSPVDSDSKSSNISDLIQTAEAYRGAALLLLRQAVPELPASCSISKLAQKTLVFLATTPPSSRTIHAQIFPLMIAGCETFDDDDREWVRQRWELMSRRLMTVVPYRCRDMTIEVWRRRDEFETRHGLRDLIKAHRPFPIISRRAMDTTTLYDSLRVPQSNIDSTISQEGLKPPSAETRSGPRSSDFPDSAAFQKGTDPVTRAGFINYTIKGNMLDVEINSAFFSGPLLPELLRRVMEYLSDDLPSLRSAALVNKSWAAEAISVLWQQPPVEALASSLDHHRQFYARQVRELNFGGSEDGKQHARFRTLEFPRLKRLTIDSYNPGNGEKLWLGQYIQPSLEEFRFYGSEPAEDLLNQLETRCPRLQSVLIDYAFEGINTGRLIQFFDCCRSLRSIHLPSFMDAFVDDQMLAYLARHNGLEELELGKTITYGMIERAFDGVEAPFQSIQRLTVQLKSKAVEPLTAAIKSATNLVLTVDDNELSPLPLVKSLSKLTELDIVFCQEGVWPATDLLALKGLRNLRRLCISSLEDPPAFPAFTDQEFIQIFEHMHHLQELVFQIQCKLSIVAITSLGTHCRELESCEIFGSYDLHGWSTIERPLFPQLRQLDLGAAVSGERASESSSLATNAQVLAQLIAEHAPKLEELYLQDDDEFSNEVVAAFKAQTGNEYNS